MIEKKRFIAIKTYTTEIANFKWTFIEKQNLARDV